ncbi:hypothetical protein E2C01_065505 [Portunus trituberculatus]|uniref:Uncharacterized protein n=1 Tax=Portunus trituberculatus TaxID=210409 RepID=A0A5B7HM27_PORTR|nr:hypothetical protein [Portunus trituberculatus]
MASPTRLPFPQANQTSLPKGDSAGQQAGEAGRRLGGGRRAPPATFSGRLWHLVDTNTRRGESYSSQYLSDPHTQPHSAPCRHSSSSS